MATFHKRKPRKKSRSLKLGFEDRRSTSLRMAGLELFSSSDFENISITRLTKLAGCSVGAFYYRYPDKTAYLKQLIVATFRGQKNSLENRYQNNAVEISLSDFVLHIVEKLSERETAGIIRVALKLGSTEPGALQYYKEYREWITNEAINIFSRRSKKKIKEQQLREAIQILFAAVNDAILMPDSTAMKLDSTEMADVLCRMVASHIGVKPEFKGRCATKKRPTELGKPDSVMQDKHEVRPPVEKKRPIKRRRRKI